MNWLQKIAATLETNDMLEHAAKAISISLPGDWKTVENRPNLLKTYNFQWYGVMTLHGTGVYQPDDEFVVKIFGFVKRSPRNMPDDIFYHPEQSKKWLDDNSVPVSNFDSLSGHNLVYYHGVVAGFIPGRNWKTKHQIDFFWGTDNPMHEIGNTRDHDPEPLYTPSDLAKWVEQVIKKGYQDFDNDGDDEPDSPIFPEWPYPEEEYTKEESDEEMAGIRDSRIRGNRMI